MPEALFTEKMGFTGRLHIFGGRMGMHILWVGLLVGLIPLLSAYWTWRSGHREWQPMVFTILTFAQMSQALAVRSESHSLFSIGPLSNRFLIGAVLLTFALQLVVVYVPFFQRIFRTEGLAAWEMLFCILLSSIVFWGVEVEKWWMRRGTA